LQAIVDFLRVSLLGALELEPQSLFIALQIKDLLIQATDSLLVLHHLSIFIIVHLSEIVLEIFSQARSINKV
jgi:hypothetical protein